MESVAHLELADLEDHHWWFVGRRRIIDTLLARLPLARTSRIIELGCGSGGNLQMLRRHGEVWAGEYDAGARARARARGIARDVEACALPDQIPFGGERFDVVAMFDVLEHVEDDRGTLANIRGRLVQGGWLVLTVPAFAMLWSPHDVRMHHFRRYTLAELEGKLRDTGFRVHYRSYFNFFLFLPVLAVRLMKNLRFGKDTVEASSDLHAPPKVVNGLLARLFAAERFAMGRFSLPFGVSCIVTAQAAKA